MKPGITITNPVSGNVEACLVNRLLIAGFATFSSKGSKYMYIILINYCCTKFMVGNIKTLLYVLSFLNSDLA